MRLLAITMLIVLLNMAATAEEYEVTHCWALGSIGTAIAVLQCDVNTTSDARPKLRDQYADGWRLVDVVMHEGKDREEVFTHFYLERPRREAR